MYPPEFHGLPRLRCSTMNVRSVFLGCVLLLIGGLASLAQPLPPPGPGGPPPVAVCSAPAAATTLIIEVGGTEVVGGLIGVVDTSVFAVNPMRGLLWEPGY